MSAQHTPGLCRAIYTDRRGAGCVRPVATKEEALMVLRGGYGAREARIEAPCGTVIGVREPADGRCDDARVKWLWWLDADPARPEEIAALAKATGEQA